MSRDLWPYVAVSAGALVIIVVILAMRSRIANLRLARQLIPSFESMRRLSAMTIGQRAPTPEELSLPPDASRFFAAAQRECEEHGLTVLGDLMEIGPDGTPSGITRWFTDPSHTVCGWLGVIRNSQTGAGKPVCILFSEGESDDFVVTCRGAPPWVIKHPPTHHEGFCEWNAGLAATLAQHQELIASAGLRPVRQPAELRAAAALVRRLRDSQARWRAKQPSGWLLEQDLRTLLGKQYRSLGPVMIKLMSEPGAPA